MKRIFREYGGAYAPETLMAPLAELEAAYLKLQHEATFKQKFQDLLTLFVGRTTPLYFFKQSDPAPGWCANISIT